MIVTEVSRDILDAANSWAVFNLFSLFFSIAIIWLALTKGLIEAVEDPRLERWGKTLNIAIIPMSLMFIFILVVTIWRISKGYIG